MAARDAATGRFTGGGGSSGGVGKLVYYLMGDSRSYTAMFRGAVRTAEMASKRIQAIGTRIQKMGQGIRRMGTRLTLGLTLPLMIMGGMAVKSFAKFDQAMIESTSIMKVTDQQIAKMRETAISLGGAAIQGPAELAKSYFYLASAGKDAEQSMALLPKVMSFATAGAFDMALATDLLTDAQSALGMTSKNAAIDAANMAHLSDLLVGANTLANASVQQFSTALTSKAGTAFKAYNIRLEEGIALLAAYADQGIKAEYAGNMTSRMLLLLTKAARDNAAVFKGMNISVFDAGGEFRTFQQIIGDMEHAFRDMSTEQKGAALSALGFEARVQAAILPLLGTSKAIGEYVKRLDQMDGMTKKVAEKQMKSFSNQLKVLKNQISVVGIEIGRVLAPVLTKLTDIIKDGVLWWRALSDETKSLIVYVGLFAATIGPLLIAFGTIVTLVGFAVVVFAKLATAVFLFSPTGWLVAGIGLLVYTIGNLTGAWESLGKVAQRVGKWFTDTFGPAFSQLGEAYNAVILAIKSGDLESAWKVATLGIEVTWLELINEMEKRWDGFVRYIGEALIGVVGEIKKVIVRVFAAFSKELLLEAASGSLMGKIIKKGLGIDKMPDAAIKTMINVLDVATKFAGPKIDKDTAETLAEFTKGMDRRQGGRDKGLASARKALAGELANQGILRQTNSYAQQFAEAMEEAMGEGVGDGLANAVATLKREVEKPLTIPVRFEGVDALRWGSGEMIDRMMQMGLRATDRKIAGDSIKTLDYASTRLGGGIIGAGRSVLTPKTISAAAGAGSVVTNKEGVRDIVARLDKVIELEEASLDMAIELENVDLE